MGYTTDFAGSFKLNKTLTVADRKVLVDFAAARHGGNTEVFPGFPSFWCQWMPSEDGNSIEWDGGEKFYEYTAWLKYIIDHFLEPKGYVLNGKVKWQGEEMDDRGELTVVDNVVTEKELE